MGGRPVQSPTCHRIPCPPGECKGCEYAISNKSQLNSYKVLCISISCWSRSATTEILPGLERDDPFQVKSFVGFALLLLQ